MDYNEAPNLYSVCTYDEWWNCIVMEGGGHSRAPVGAPSPVSGMDCPIDCPTSVVPNL